MPVSDDMVFWFPSTQWVDEDEQEGAAGIDESEFSGAGGGGSEYHFFAYFEESYRCLSDVSCRSGGNGHGLHDGRYGRYGWHGWSRRNGHGFDDGRHGRH